MDIKTKSIKFNQGLEKLGFENDDSLFLTNDNKSYHEDPQITFHIEKAKKFKASAVYLRKEFTGNYKPQVYLFDFTNEGFSNNNEAEIAHIQKQIWSSGEVPLACFFYDTGIKIIDCTTSIKSDNNKYKPVYLFEQLKVANKVNKLYNEQFAIKIKSGVFWDELENKSKFKFTNSAYDILIKWIQKVTEVLKKDNLEINKPIINKIIIQSILIKYLEDKKDENEQNLFGEKYFPQFDNSKTFIDVLRKRKFVDLLEKLHIDFNGNLFEWKESEKEIIKQCNLNVLANALEGQSHPDGQGVFEFIKLYEFNYIPVELISRIYEEFLAGDKKKKDVTGDKQNIKQEEGIYYTPSHLAKLLVDEAMPLKNFDEFDPKTYKILDPACGSGIFLVIAFKRLVQWWRLKNGIEKPRNVDILKELLQCVYGTDKEEQATQLAAFSLCLALCDELSPLQIIEDLKFNDLTQSNILYTDFFINELRPYKDQDTLLIEKQKANLKKINEIKFDLVIGNPPFNRGAIKEYSKIWEYENEKVDIPQGQIALKFLSESLPFLKGNGVLCLIIKSSGLLYNSSSEKYKELLFSNFNIIQIFDFTALARNQALWDNGADVDSAAIFIRKTSPDFKKNILHVTFRRTKATKERLVFEIDDYDLHFVNRQVAIENQYIWKSNLLGGGRIKSTITKLKLIDNLNDFVNKNKSVLICNEGAGGAKSLPNESFTENGIQINEKSKASYLYSFEGLKDKKIYSIPNFLVKENIDLPFCLNDEKFKFNNEVVGFHSEDRNLLKRIADYFKINYGILKFYAICTSGKMLVYKNTAMKKEDILNLPFSEDQNIMDMLSNFDNKIIGDVTDYMQLFLRNGENSKAVQPINSKNFESIIKSYGNEFCSVLNIMYEEEKKKFRLSDVVPIEDSYIATVFKYDELADEPTLHPEQKGFDISGLTHHQVSRHLNTNRIIKLYPQKDTIVFVKPNQYRYWLSLIAYRDADKCFADLSKAGY